MDPDDEMLPTDTAFEDWFAPPVPGFPIVTLAYVPGQDVVSVESKICELSKLAAFGCRRMCPLVLNDVDPV